MTCFNIANFAILSNLISVFFANPSRFSRRGQRRFKNARVSLEGDKQLFENHRVFLEGDKLCRSGQGFWGGVWGMFNVKCFDTECGEFRKRAQR